MLDRVDVLTLIEMGRYESVTVLDADIVCNKPVHRTLDCGNSILYFPEEWQRLHEWPAGSMYTGRMTDAECTAFAHDYPINAGHFTIPGALLTAFTHEYLRVVEGPLIWGTDQAALNAIIRRGTFPARPYRKYGICNASQTSEKRWCAFDLVHFAGVTNRLDFMRERVGRYEPSRHT
jgi:hypothetical protein